MYRGGRYKHIRYALFLIPFFMINWLNYNKKVNINWLHLDIWKKVLKYMHVFLNLFLHRFWQTNKVFLVKALESCDMTSFTATPRPMNAPCPRKGCMQQFCWDTFFTRRGTLTMGLRHLSGRNLGLFGKKLKRMEGLRNGKD